LSNYGTFLIVDPEEEYFPQEITLIQNAVQNGMNLVVLGDWYNELLLENIKFEDPNTSQQIRYPETGGSNLPALNELIGRFGFALGDQVLDGTVNLFNREVRIASGAPLRAAPLTAWIATGSLNNIVISKM
jgi:membrane-bound transcription factor site-1 protease